MTLPRNAGMTNSASGMTLPGNVGMTNSASGMTGLPFGMALPADRMTNPHVRNNFSCNEYSCDVAQKDFPANFST